MAENEIKDITSEPGTQNSDLSSRLFNKDEENLTEMEKMMVGILKKRVEEESSSVQEETEAVQEEPAATAENDSEQVKIYTPSAEPSHPQPTRVADTAPQYARSLEREEKIVKEAKKRGRAGAIIPLICMFIVIGALIANAMITDKKEKELAAAASDPSMPIANDGDYEYEIEPAPTLIVIISDTSSESEEEPAVPQTSGEHEYRFIVDDLSWTEARDACAALGGHLVTVNSDAELAAIIDMAEENNINKVWVGWHRENGTGIWEGSGGPIEFLMDNYWGRNEPSYYDGDVAENYLLLWYFNGSWCFNDSRDDPAADYPEMYSGQLAYICEFD